MEKQFKVVLLSKVGNHLLTAEEFDELARVNAELVETAYKSEDEIIEAVRDADVILRTGGQITRRVMEAAPKCKAIITLSVGFDLIDVDAATDNNIIVVNNPTSQWCVEEVSNHAIALLLACAKNLVPLNNSVKQGRWAEAKQAQAPKVSIHDQTLGLVGCGSIGQLVAKKAQCFRLKVIGYDPYLDKSLAKEHGITLVGLPELLKESDFISIHTFLSEETRHLIGEREFKQMKPTAYLINTARGSVVNEATLIKALQEKWIAGAGLDVFEKEPIDSNNPLLKMDNVVVTPHSASYSDASKLARTVILQEAIRVLSGKWPKNVVNKTVKPKINLVKEVGLSEQ